MQRGRLAIHVSCVGGHSSIVDHLLCINPECASKEDKVCSGYCDRGSPRGLCLCVFHFLSELTQICLTFLSAHLHACVRGGFFNVARLKFYIIPKWLTLDSFRGMYAVVEIVVRS